MEPYIPTLCHSFFHKANGYHITVDEPKEGDLIQKVGEITFWVERGLFLQYSGFILLCGEENGLGTFSLEPVFKPEHSGCGSCSGCSSSDNSDYDDID